jgi:hypothetical protein
MKIAATLTVALAALLTSATSAQAMSPAHIDRLALTAQRQAAVMAQTLRNDFRHSSRYSHLYRDASQMYWKANHIHKLAHHGIHTRTELRHLRRDIAELDRLQHHMQEMVDSMIAASRHRGGHHRRHSPAGVSFKVGNGWSFSVGGHHGHHGHASPSVPWRLRQLASQLSSIEDTIHHLQDDLR